MRFQQAPYRIADVVALLFILHGNTSFGSLAPIIPYRSCKRYLAGARNLSPNTIKSYRDTFCLLLLFMKEMNKKIDRICLVDIDADLVVRFLDWLELERRNSASTRNVRLAAIHAFFRYVQFQNPEMLLHCQRVPCPVSWTVKMKKKQKETQDILSYHTQAAGCSDKARAKASGGRQPIEECGRTGL